MPRQLVRNGTADGTKWNAYVAWGGGKYWLATPDALTQAVKDFGYPPINVDDGWMQAAGPVSGPNPTGDPWGCWTG